MKIAIVHPYAIHSRGVGGVTRLYQLVRFLADRHDVYVLAHAHGRPDEEAAARDELEGLGVPHQFFPRPASPLWKKLAWAIDSTPYFVRHNRNPALESALSELDARVGLDVVHLEFGYLEPLISNVSGSCARVLADQEMMSLVVKRLAKVPMAQKSLYQHYISLEAQRIRRFEAHALRSFDRVFGITPAEARAMQELAGRSVEVLPHVVDTQQFTPAPAIVGVSQESATPAGADDRGKAPDPAILYVGNYGHHPNVEAVLWLAVKVLPRIKQSLPDLRCDIVGPGLTDDWSSRLRELGCNVLGRVEDLEDRYRRSTVFVNPIFSGGGMRGKVLEAFSCGRPVVSTALGLEGIAARLDRHCLGAEDPEGFSQQVVRLVHDADLRTRLGEAARKLVVEEYDTRSVFTRLEGAYEDALETRRGRLQSP